MDPSPCAAVQANPESDAVLEVGGKCFPVNRWALARHSSYFEAMFFGGTRERAERHIRIQGLEVEPFQALLDFTRTGSLGITPGNVTSLLQTADFLRLEAAKRRCETFLERELHVSNCLSLRAYAQHFACVALDSAALNVALSHWADVVTHGEVEELPKKALVELLQSDELFVAREDMVFDTVMQWVVADLLGRAKDFLELMGLVRVPFLSLPFLGLLVKRSQRPGMDAPAQLLKELDRFPPPNWQDAAQAPCASRSYETLFVMAGKRDQEQQELFHFLPKTGAWQACSPLKRRNLTQYAVAAVGRCCESAWCHAGAEVPGKAGSHLSLPGGSNPQAFPFPNQEQSAGLLWAQSLLSLCSFCRQPPLHQGREFPGGVFLGPRGLGVDLQQLGRQLAGGASHEGGSR
ncbi:hypothetical protein L345_15053, partial [Ophiophagus hannah]